MRRESDNNNISGNNNTSNYPSNLVPSENNLSHLNYHHPPPHNLSGYGAGSSNYGSYQASSK